MTITLSTTRFHHPLFPSYGDILELTLYLTHEWNIRFQISIFKKNQKAAYRLQLSL